MAKIANTAFETNVTNAMYDRTLNVPGVYVVDDAGTLTSEECPAGFLVVHEKLLPNDGYQGLGDEGADILNGNTWYNVLAEDGTAGLGGDKTGIYAFNSYDVSKAINGDNQYIVGMKTLGLSLPAGNIGDFTEICIGNQYTFGSGNFSTLPASAAAIYCTIADGLLVASTTAPTAGTGVWFEILRKKGFTIGARNAGFDGYVVMAKRS